LQNVLNLKQAGMVLKSFDYFKKIGAQSLDVGSEMLIQVIQEGVHVNCYTSKESMLSYFIKLNIK
jgi:hypothetical protein